jgi:hypothetical protein
MRRLQNRQGGFGYESRKIGRVEGVVGIVFQGK